MKAGEQAATKVIEQTSEGTMVKRLLEKAKESMNQGTLDEETTRAVERIVELRVCTKHINLWMCQFDMKGK